MLSEPPKLVSVTMRVVRRLHRQVKAEGGAQLQNTAGGASAPTTAASLSVAGIDARGDKTLFETLSMAGQSTAAGTFNRMTILFLSMDDACTV